MNNAYYLVLFSLIFSHYCSLFFNQRNNKIFDLHIFFLILFIGFRHKVGGDWGTYQGLLFENKYLTLSEFFSTVTLNSFGYKLFIWIFSSFDLGVFFLNLLSASVFMIGVRILVYNFNYRYLALILAFPTLIVIVGMGFTKQSVAIGFFLIAFDSLLKQQNKKYVFYVVIASLFHLSALVFLILIFSRKKYFLIILFIFMTLIYVLYSYSKFIYILNSINFYSYIKNYVLYEVVTSNGANLRIILNIIPTFLLLIFYNHFDMKDKNKLIFINLSIVQFLILFISFILPNATGIDRISFYLIILQIFIYCEFSNLFKKQFLKNIYIFLIQLYSIILLYIWVNFSLHSIYWIPYTTIFSKY